MTWLTVGPAERCRCMRLEHRPGPVAVPDTRSWDAVSGRCGRCGRSYRTHVRVVDGDPQPPARPVRPEDTAPTEPGEPDRVVPFRRRR